MKRWTWVLVLLVSGCGVLQPPEPERFHVLLASKPAESAMPPSPPAPGARSGQPRLRVTPVSASAFYDTQEIVFSRSPGTRSYYQFNHWTESPTRRIETALVERLRASGRFETVEAMSAGIRSDWLLTVRVEELYHDAQSPPGSARVTLLARLRSPDLGAISHQRFACDAQAKTFDADGAVAAMDAALNCTLEEITRWSAVVATRDAMGTHP